MQLTKTFSPNSAIFIEKKWLENRLWGAWAHLRIRRRTVGTSRLYCPTGYCTSRESHTRILLTSDSHGPYSPKDSGSNRAFFFSYTEHTCRVVNTSSLP